MDIQVKSFLSKEQSLTTVTFPDGATVKQVREALGSSDELLIVNGLVRPDNYHVSPGDTVVLMPILAGG